MHQVLDTDAAAVGLDVPCMSARQILDEIELSAEYAASDTCEDREATKVFIARLAAEGRRLRKITSAEAVAAIRKGERRAARASGKVFDVKCPKCGHTYNWEGELTECPPCPKCGNAK